MGVVLPHGGFESFGLNDSYTWGKSNLWLGDSEALAQASFAVPNQRLGYHCNGALIIPLLLCGDGDVNPQVSWRLCADGIRPPGFPQYLVTKETYQSLEKANVHDDKLEIDGVGYQLHAAYIDWTHVALLLRV